MGRGMVDLTFDEERVPLRVTDGGTAIEGLLELGNSEQDWRGIF